MAKRGATKELTQDNWADEEESEEMGTFKMASSNTLASRQIKKARRRGAADGPASDGVFKGLTSFAAFGTGNKDTSSAPTFSFLSKDTTADAPAKPTFSFFSNTNKSDANKTDTGPAAKKQATQPFQLSQESVSASPKSSDAVKTNGIGSVKSDSVTSGKSGSSQFLAHLKSLNEGVLNWVKEHLDKNPHVDLSPVFDDYKKHFEELTKKYPASSKNDSDTDKKSDDSKVDAASEKENKPLVEEKDRKESSTLPAFSFSAASATTTNSAETKTFSFGLSSKSAEQKDDSKDKDTDKPKFSFGNFNNKSSEPSSVFGNAGKASSGFTFGSLPSSQPSSGFTFGSSSASQAAPKAGSTEGATPDDPSDEPPVVEVKEVKEDDALYEKKCKLFYMKDGAYVEKGVGTLFLKPAGEKTQLVVRALTNLGNILLNILLTTSIPTVRAGKNGLMIACVPNPPLDANKPSNEPVKMLIRVKTSEDADHLLEKINEYKK